MHRSTALDSCREPSRRDRVPIRFASSLWLVTRRGGRVVESLDYAKALPEDCLYWERAHSNSEQMPYRLEGPRATRINHDDPRFVLVHTTSHSPFF
jgi:hypothetical protein